MLTLKILALVKANPTSLSSKKGTVFSKKVGSIKSSDQRILAYSPVASFIHLSQFLTGPILVSF